MDARELEAKQMMVTIDKLIVESMKLTEEALKLQREGRKLQRESRWYPVALLIAAMGIIATLFKTIH